MKSTSSRIWSIQITAAGVSIIVPTLIFSSNGICSSFNRVLAFFRRLFACIISETLDFDNAIEVVLQFAAEDKNTLVLITADHETGGYGITGSNKKSGKLETSFLNKHHTATMVPLFAFGPGAINFIGTYHNNDLQKKILSVLKINH